MIDDKEKQKEEQLRARHLLQAIVSRRAKPQIQSYRPNRDLSKCGRLEDIRLDHRR